MSISIVKSIRWVGKHAGAVLDAEDRKLLGQALVLALSGATIVVLAAGALGLAWRVFGLAAG